MGHTKKKHTLKQADMADYDDNNSNNNIDDDHLLQWKKSKNCFFLKPSSLNVPQPKVTVFSVSPS